MLRMNSNPRHAIRLVFLVTVFTLTAASCGDDWSVDEALLEDAVATYAAGVRSAY